MRCSKNLKIQDLMLFILLSALILSSCSLMEETEVHRIGLLSGVGSFDNVITAFKDKMTELGHIEGENIEYDFQSADADKQKMTQIADNFARDRVDIILTTTTGAAKACREAVKDTDISIVFTIIVDAIGSGLVEDLRQPGRNATGVSRPDQVFLGKRVEFLKDLSPAIKKLWILYDPEYPTAQGSVPALRHASSILDMELIETKIHSAAGLIAELKKHSGKDNANIDALLIMPDPLNSKCAKNILAFADEYNLPVAGNKPSHARDGALFSYCDDNIETGNLAASLADKVLRGTSPAVIPVLFSEPRLYVNLRALKRLGFENRENLLSQAVEIYR